jgi:malonate decarboxylase epsilon subunit
VIAVLFPGQGSQRPGMLRDLASLPGGAATVEEACTVLQRDLYADDGEFVMESTAAAQRVLLVTGVASMRALGSMGLDVAAVAGHSVGAFAAAVACDALDFADALRLVDARGEAMAKAFSRGYGMAAVGGLDESEVSEIVGAAFRPEAPVYAATVNAPDQILVAGSCEGIARALEFARERGARTQWLPVNVPAHTVLMAPVAEELGRLFDGLDVSGTRAYYATNASGRTVRDGARIRNDLIESVARPVRWADATTALYERGVRLFIEARPGTVLSDLAARAFPEARAIALETATLAAVATLASLVDGSPAFD